MSDKPFLTKILPFLKARYAPRGARISFAGSGEDLIMSDILKKLGVKKAFYLDIGAGHPIFGSNTYLFYQSGGQGVLVEPNKDICEKIRERRPRDVCLHMGVGKINKEADFFSFAQSTRSTFSAKEAKAWENTSGQKPKIEKCPVFSLDSVINDHCGGRVPDVVSIDTEGLDFEILSGFSWIKRPKLFCVESAAPGDKLGLGGHNKDLYSLMGKHGYGLLGRTLINAIFVDQFYGKV